MNHGCPLSPSCSAICHSHSGVVQNRNKGHDPRASRFHSVQETRDRWRSNTLVNWKCVATSILIKQKWQDQDQPRDTNKSIPIKHPEMKLVKLIQHRIIMTRLSFQSPAPQAVWKTQHLLQSTTGSFSLSFPETSPETPQKTVIRWAKNEQAWIK